MDGLMLSSDIKAYVTSSDALPARVIVVDDSAVIRGVITRELEGQSGFKVVATAANGELAVSSLQRQAADVIILDIEMPVMDGLTAIPLLKAIDPSVQILMASTLTQKNAEISLKAMSLGAADYISKPTSTVIANGAEFKRELLEKVKALAIVARRRGVRMPAPGGTKSYKPATQPVVESKKISLRQPSVIKPDVIAIGSSTGGPQALFDVIKVMGNDLTQPIVITQHMPPAFTSILADHISKQCNVTCVEGADGVLLKPGTYYIAPGDFHMLLQRTTVGTVIKLTKDAPENYCRPAVDPMLRSLTAIYGKAILTVILTGMGYDGCKGSQNVVDAGGTVIAQDEATSVVWGMPGAVANAGLCAAILPINAVGSAVRQMAMKGRL